MGTVESIANDMHNVGTFAYSKTKIYYLAGFFGLVFFQGNRCDVTLINI